jgi:hypothetical protein
MVAQQHGIVSSSLVKSYFFFCVRLFFMVLIEWSLVDTTTFNMSFKDIASHIPMFAGQDFRFWKESMMDYLGAQRLLGYVL